MQLSPEHAPPGRSSRPSLNFQPTYCQLQAACSLLRPRNVQEEYDRVTLILSGPRLHIIRFSNAHRSTTPLSSFAIESPGLPTPGKISEPAQLAESLV